MDTTLREALETLRRAKYEVTPDLGTNNWRLTYPPDGEGRARAQELVSRDRLLDIAYQVEQEGNSKDEPKFGEAPEVEAIARRLIPQFHSHLVEAKIRYLWRYGDWESRGQTILGKCYKLSARDEFLTGFHFLIMINWPAWQKQTPEQRTALVDHELCHAGKDEDKDGNPRWRIVNHDVEEFSAIIDRHGLWKPDVEQFSRVAARKYRQLELPLDQIVEDANALAADIGVEVSFERFERERTEPKDQVATGEDHAPDGDDTTVTITDCRTGRSVTTTSEGLGRAADELAVRRGATAGPGY